MDQNLLKNHGKVLNCWRYNGQKTTNLWLIFRHTSGILRISQLAKFLDDLYLRGRCRGGTALATFASAPTDDSWCENVPIFHGSTGISSLFMAKHGEHVAEMDQKKQKNTLYFVCSHLEVLELGHHVLIAEVVFLVVPETNPALRLRGHTFLTGLSRCHVGALPTPTCCPGSVVVCRGLSARHKDGISLNLRSQLIKPRVSKKRQHKRNCNHVPQKGFKFQTTETCRVSRVSSMWRHGQEPGMQQGL